MEQRRKIEKQLILDKDLNSEEDSGSSSDEEEDSEKMYFMISSDWLQQWKSFISNKKTDKKFCRVSPNPDIGVLPPGPILNDSLFFLELSGNEIVSSIK